MHSVAIYSKYSDYWHIWYLDQEKLDLLKNTNSQIIMDVIFC